MRRNRFRPPRALAVGLVAAVALGAAGCGSEGGTGGGSSGGSSQSGGSIPSGALKGATITVGSKEFTEQKLLGQITLQALKAAGADVKDQTGLAGSVAARKALTSGNIDLYWEYTGTAWLTYLKKTKPIPDGAKQFQAVAQQDLAQNQIKWIDQAPENNTYAFATNAANYNKLGVKKISDFKTLVAQRPQDASVCVGEEFTSRDDGLPGVEKTYDFKFPKVIKIDEGLIYDQTKKGASGGGKCNFGEVFTTDGRIRADNLKLIEDDQDFFPKYNAAVSIREDVLKKYPKIEQVLAPIAKKLDDPTMQSLNSKVDVEGLTEDEVAGDWLKDQGFIG